MIFETRKQLAEYFGKQENDESVVIVWHLLKIGMVKDEHLIGAFTEGEI